MRILGSEEIPHAFLFSGPKGTGKTSAARILAKVVNCMESAKGEPCNKCESCVAITKGHSMDVIEIDAASNRGIDDIRALREHIALSPASAKKKVYIIDEAHMLTTEAANAFLKTLEEPPAHAMFVLATTDPQKLLPTIHSRLTNVVFTKAKDEEIARQLARVIKGEGLDIEDGVTREIAQRSDGSFRDAVKILESLSLGDKKITLKSVQKYLEGGTKISEKLAGFLRERNLTKSLGAVEEYVSGGGGVRDLVDSLIEKLRMELLEGKAGEDLVVLIDELITSRARIAISPVAQLPLEIVIVKWCKQNSKPEARNPKTETPKVKIEGKKIVGVGESCLTRKAWERVLTEVRQKNFAVNALLRAAQPISFDGRRLTVGVYYKFHKEGLETNSNRQVLEEIVGEVLGYPVRVVCDLTPRPMPVLTEKAEEDIIETAKEIFES